MTVLNNIFYHAIEETIHHKKYCMYFLIPQSSFEQRRKIIFYCNTFS
jgi:hypothetical protein